jgi:mRNA interferase MazF
MRRGEVWWISFDPSIGGEIQKKRPAVIISNNAANKYLNRVQVVPLTINIGKVYASEAIITINSNTSKAMTDQLATVSKLRLIEKAGVLSDEDMKKIEKAIMIQLALDDLH